MKPEEILRRFEAQRLRGWLILVWVAQLVVGVLIALPVWLEAPALAPLIVAGWMIGFWVIRRSAGIVVQEAAAGDQASIGFPVAELTEPGPVRAAIAVMKRNEESPDLTPHDVEPDEVADIVAHAEIDPSDAVETDSEHVALTVLSDLSVDYPWDRILVDDLTRERVLDYAIRVSDDPESMERLETSARTNPQLRELLDKAKATVLDAESPRVGSDPSDKKFSKDTDLLVIVHGTWAAKKTWWRPGGDFFSYIDDKEADNLEPFDWSGGNRHSSRKDAAEKLVKWARERPHRNLDVIAHSHGGNVCFLASQMGLKICHLVLLGTPIRLEYIPNLRNTNMIHNVFSTWDDIQSPVGTKPNPRGEGRTLADTAQTINHRVEDPWRDPSHSALHSPEVWEEQGLWELVHN